MKQSHKLRCEVVALIVGVNQGHRIQDEVQKRLDLGWTLRAAPAVGEWVYLIFVRKEARPR